MAERIFYKVTDKGSEFFEKCCNFLQREEELRKAQKEAIEARVPKFETYRAERGFNRIVRYTGFVFVDQENIDPKVWVTKEVGGKMCSKPNRRTKAGKEMDEFLKNFRRTNAWDVDKLFGIDKQSIIGSFYPADLFKHNDIIYICIDDQYREMFEEGNKDAVEITHGEIDKAIEEYNMTF